MHNLKHRAWWIFGGLLIFFFTNRFIEIQLTYHKIHPFQVYGLTVLSLFPELYNHSHHLVLELLAFSSAQRKINICSILFIYFFNTSRSPSNLFHRRVTTADEKTRVRGFTKISHLFVTRVLKDRHGSAHAAGGARGKVSQWPQPSVAIEAGQESKPAPHRTPHCGEMPSLVTHCTKHITIRTVARQTEFKPH